ncbi:MAG: hypothetical protein A3J38_06915 [Gammaproteobacteria bacterium RIFCSPHIGHO2_12_FULL_45_9]|nr:MAG: hypothetical protein A3J38_06915 [Gammaproteobacteria bacterium RIFCSPHIGHO2_12_FULL_45_9]
MGVNLSNQHLLLIYMVMGGIPFYLSKIKKNRSATQIIEELAFSSRALLLEEFENLFSSLFDESSSYIQIIRMLAEHHEGIGKRTLLEMLGKSEVGGAGTQKLQALADTGFIMSFKPLYHKKKGTYYRLIDEYTLFYLKWIEPIKDTLSAEAVETGCWQATQNTPRWYNWQGYAFEAVCYKHLREIRKALALLPNAMPSTWRYISTKGHAESGTQIDLLFDRQDDAITLCEIKCTDQPFVINKEYVDILQQKIAIFKAKTKTRKQLFMTMISANGIKDNYYAEHLIQKTVTLDDLFNT